MKYETYDKEYQANVVDVAFFWTAQLGFFVFWAVLIFIKILSLAFIFEFIWFFLVCLAEATNAINLYAFYQCRKEYSEKLKDIKKMVGMNMIQRAL